MTRYITLDLGTTKSKISIAEDGAVIDSLLIGSSRGTDDFKLALRGGISRILERNSLSEKDVVSILATGTMATAEFGICPLEHIEAPAGIEELSARAEITSIPEISPIPFFVVRGIKTSCTSPEGADMMRGEESEIIGISSAARSECAYMLMGSHTKIVTTDKRGRITDISTLLTGELASAIVSSTILRHSVKFEDSTLNEEHLFGGYEYCVRHSLSEALFKVRVLKNSFGASYSDAYSFFIGAVLAGDVGHVIKSGAPRIIVGGNRYLRRAVTRLLLKYSAAEVVCLSDDECENAVSLGLVKIFEYRNQ